jgi:hypothetical protein
VSLERPPSAARKTAHGVEWWVCFYCEKPLVRTNFALLPDREVWKCERCGRIQALGKKVHAEESLPAGVDLEKLARARKEYRDFEAKNGKPPSLRKLAELTGIYRLWITTNWKHISGE